MERWPVHLFLSQAKCHNPRHYRTDVLFSQRQCFNHLIIIMYHPVYQCDKYHVVFDDNSYNVKIHE